MKCGLRGCPHALSYRFCAFVVVIVFNVHNHIQHVAKRYEDSPDSPLSPIVFHCGRPHTTLAKRGAET